jgi:hypothetical protein
MILKLAYLRFTSQREDLHAEIGGDLSSGLRAVNKAGLTQKILATISSW